MHNITIKNNKVVPLLAGHPWVFSGALIKKYEAILPGSLVNVYDERKNYLATGFYNYNQNIAFRAVNFIETEEINYNFLFKRIKTVYNYKKKYYSKFNTTGFRLINADADYLPGLIIDVYENTAVFSVSVLGMEVFINNIIDILKELNFTYIIEKSVSNNRTTEGLAIKPVLVHYNKSNNNSIVSFKENNMNMIADVINGQKTGYFLDQRRAREWLKNNSDNANIINLFCYSGAFSIAAISGNASSVVSVDISKEALELLNLNLKTNYSNVQFKNTNIKEDVFVFLKNIQLKPIFNKNNNNILICDPPAFAKSKSAINKAIAGYIKLNEMCLQTLDSGDIFITSSCSGIIKMEEFINILKKSALMANKKLVLLHSFIEDADHTNLISFSEGSYLKTLILKVI